MPNKKSGQVRSKKGSLRNSKKKDDKANPFDSKKFALIFTAAVVLAAAVWFLFLNKPKPKFDGNQAFKYLEKQVDFGPRVPGTDAHLQTKNYLVNELKKYADLVSEQKFSYKDKHDTTKIYNCTNIVASFNVNPDVKERVLLCAHWDSRPWADQDPDSNKRNQPVLAANDGASGVGVLLEMARIFKNNPPDIGVDIVFFDLEDIGDENQGEEPGPNQNQFGIGAEKFVEQNPDYVPAFGILLDMVGDKNLSIPKELNSIARAGQVVDKIWSAAKKVGATAFKDERGSAIMDDHIPFLKKYIPVADIIQYPFPKSWHTAGDTTDKCSPESLQQIGNVLVEVIYDE